MEIQQCKVKSTFPARIAPFSVPLGRMEAAQGLRKARFERETWTYFALLYLHNGRGKNLRAVYDLQKSIVTGLLYVHISILK